MHPCPPGALPVYSSIGFSLNEPDNPRTIAIVFVHGLLSSGAAWDEMENLVRNDPSLADIKTYKFSYRTTLTKRTITKRTPTLDEVADSLATYLDYNVQETEVILATHSQGGLVALRMLSRNFASPSHRHTAVRSIVLYACPQAGSSFAWTSRQLLLWGHPQERSLRPLDTATSESVRTVALSVIQKSTPFGDIRVKAVAGVSDGVVTLASAKSMWPDVETVAGDHKSIIRPGSTQEASFLILQRAVHEVAKAPDVSGMASAPEAPSSYWRHLADELSRRLQFDTWDYSVGGLTRSSYVVSSEVLADFHSCSAWILGRVYPSGHESLTRPLNTLSAVLIDLLEVFGRHTELADSGPSNSWVRVPRWYKQGGYNPTYDRDLQEYLDHVNLLTDLAFELSRAADWFCDAFRREIDPTWRLVEGGFVLETGPHQGGDTLYVRPMYSDGERQLSSGPYLGLVDFAEVSRWNRDFHTRKRDQPEDPSTAEELEQKLLEEQLERLESELDAYRRWRTEGGRLEGMAALELGTETGLISSGGYRVPIWETDLHLRFALSGKDLEARIESHGGRSLFEAIWTVDIGTMDMYRILDQAMRDLGKHPGPLLFSPLKGIQEAVDSLLFAARYRAQALRSGSEHFRDLVECVDGWYISEERIFPREHPFYSIVADRLDEMDWESHISTKGWTGIHAALEVARALLLDNREGTAGP